MLTINDIYKHHEEYLKFDRVENPLHPRPDICALLMLDKIMPKSSGNIISDAFHEEVFLAVDVDTFLIIATEEEVIDLIRCGITYNAHYNKLCLNT